MTLAELADVSASAYDEVRQSIFGLRTMVSGGLGFVPTLAELLHGIHSQALVLPADGDFDTNNQTLQVAHDIKGLCDGGPLRTKLLVVLRAA